MAKSAVAVLVIGIPGAGKSYFVSHLAQHFSGGQVVAFDSYVDAECVWNENTFKQYRESALHDIKQIVTENNSSESKDSILIIDDYMYLRSMRREVYVIARDNNTKLLCIWIDCTLDNAIRRNNFRIGSGKISEESISRISALFESPDSSYIADRHFVCIDNNEKNSLEAGLVDSITKIQELQSEIFQLPSVYAAEVDRKSKISDEKSTISYLQRIDIFLRKMISLIQSYLTEVPVEQRKLISRSLCTMKSNLLEIARHDAVALDPIDIAHELCELDQSKYVHSIKEYIGKNLPKHIARIIDEKL